MIGRWKGVLVVLAALGAGCTSLSATLPGQDPETNRPVADVPPPPGCELEWFTAFDGSQHRYAFLVYRGRVSAEAVITHYEKQMPRENWQQKEVLRHDETIMRFAKAGAKGAAPRQAYCDVTVCNSDWLGRRYVVVTVTGHRAK
jgi:hypothetical protein